MSSSHKSNRRIDIYFYVNRLQFGGGWYIVETNRESSPDEVKDTS